MIEPTSPPPPLAVHCQYLSREGRDERREPASLCTHPARDGRECIGPFLQDLSTDCGFWEEAPESHLIPLPQPGRWQGRRRRQGFDLQAGRSVWGVDWR